MLEASVTNHLARVRGQTIGRYTMEQVPEWICRHTTIKGEPFSYENHEYQEKILRDASREVVVRKCSQVGVTEMSVRQAVALCSINSHYTVIYTLPTARDAGKIMTTRVDPVIQGSTFLSELIDKRMDNSNVKQLGQSYLYMNGSASGNAPISTPADHLIHDELDFSDLDIIEQYQSRLTHSKIKRKTKFSTPTQPNFGIDAEFQESRRHFNMVRCCHCNHYFIPDYYKHVRIPGYKKDLEEITRRNLTAIRWREAHIICPSCGKEPSLQVAHREWVCENASDNFLVAGYQISPFDAPNIVSVPELVETSTKYARRSQFVNFNLGLPMADVESTLMEDELRGAIVQRSPLASVSYVMGIDLGQLCHIIVGAVLPDGRLILVHCEQVHAAKLVDRRLELARKYWPRITVADSQPYTETVYRMQDQDPNLFGAVYVTKKSIETYSVVDKEEVKDEAFQELRMVNVNRNKALDELMDALRVGNIVKMTDDMDDLWVAHLQDMKRIQRFTSEKELEFVWSKSKAGTDHFHHATLYTSIAAKMLGVSHSRIVLPSVMRTFKVKNRRN